MNLTSDPPVTGLGARGQSADPGRTSRISRLVLRVWTALRDFAGDTAAIVAVELALLSPLLMLIGVGGTEIARWVLLEQKLSRTVGEVVDLFTQQTTIIASQGKDFLIASAYTMSPFTIGTSGILLVSSISNTSGTLGVDWQLSSGSLASVSKFGTKGSTVTASKVGVTLASGESVVAAELFYNYVPLFYTGLYHPSTPIYRTAYFRPRLSSKVTCSSGC